MSAAIMLARKGFQVTILEKNHACGRQAQSTSDRRIQLRPWTLDLYAACRSFVPSLKGMANDLRTTSPCNASIRSGATSLKMEPFVDLWEDPERMRTELARFGPQVFDEYKQFLAYSRRQYEIVERGYLAMAWTPLASSFAFMDGGMPATSIICVRCQAAFTSV